MISDQYFYIFIRESIDFMWKMTFDDFMKFPHFEEKQNLGTDKIQD